MVGRLLDRIKLNICVWIYILSRCSWFFLLPRRFCLRTLFIFLVFLLCLFKQKGVFNQLIMCKGLRQCYENVSHWHASRKGLVIFLAAYSFVFKFKVNYWREAPEKNRICSLFVTAIFPTFWQKNTYNFARSQRRIARNFSLKLPETRGVAAPPWPPGSYAYGTTVLTGKPEGVRSLKGKRQLLPMVSIMNLILFLSWHSIL